MRSLVKNWTEDSFNVAFSLMQVLYRLKVISWDEYYELAFTISMINEICRA